MGGPVVHQLSDFGFGQFALLPPIGEVCDYFRLRLGFLGSIWNATR